MFVIGVDCILSCKTVILCDWEGLDSCSSDIGSMEKNKYKKMTDGNEHGDTHEFVNTSLCTRGRIVILMVILVVAWIRGVIGRWMSKTIIGNLLCHPCGWCGDCECIEIIGVECGCGCGCVRSASVATSDAAICAICVGAVGGGGRTAS